MKHKFIFKVPEKESKLTENTFVDCKLLNDRRKKWQTSTRASVLCRIFQEVALAP